MDRRTDFGELIAESERRVRDFFDRYDRLPRKEYGLCPPGGCRRAVPAIKRGRCRFCGSAPVFAYDFVCDDCRSKPAPPRRRIESRPGEAGP